LTLLIFTLGLCSNAQTDTKIDWISDLRYLQQELPKNHYDLFFQLSEHDFNRGIDKLIQNVPELTDYEILNRLLQLIAKIGDSHTGIGIGEFRKADQILPFSLYWFSDGLYIIGARLGFEQLLGKKLISINGFGITQIVDSLSTLIVVDNQSSIKNRIPRLINFVPHLTYFGFADSDGIDLILKDVNGIESNLSISISELKRSKVLSYEPDSMAFCWRNKNRFFTEDYFKEDSIYYVQYNRCWSKEVEMILGSRKRAKTFPSFLKFQKEILKTIEQQPIEKIVFDLRFNGGGASHLGTRLIKKLTSTKVNQKGKLFVITGFRTFSSGLINTIDFRNHTAAIFVGDLTSGKPNSYGEIKKMSLPSSGLVLSYSTKYFELCEQDKDAFYPDVLIETSFHDYNSGIDPVFEYIRTTK